MSVLRLAALAGFLAMAPFSAQASAVMPEAFVFPAQTQEAASGRSASLKLAQTGAPALLVSRTDAGTSFHLPLASWLLGALLIGLMATEFRHSGAVKR